jgi:hypothetical protein
VKLYVRTPAGTDLGIDILLTSLVKETGDKITSVQIYMPICGHVIVGYSVEPQPKGRGGSEILWIDPGDLRADDGATVNQEAIRAEVARVKESLHYEDMYGSLGKNWP